MAAAPRPSDADRNGDRGNRDDDDVHRGGQCEWRRAAVENFDAAVVMEKEEEEEEEGDVGMSRGAESKCGGFGGFGGVSRFRFSTKHSVGIDFEETEDGQWEVQRVQPGSQADKLGVLSGHHLLAIDKKPPPADARGLVLQFKKLRVQRKHMVLSFSSPSLFRQPRPNLYNYST